MSIRLGPSQLFHVVEVVVHLTCSSRPPIEEDKPLPPTCKEHSVDETTVIPLRDSEIKSLCESVSFLKK